MGVKSMRDIITQPIRVILLNDTFREEGSFKDQSGQTINYDRGYILTALPYGAKRANDIRKYTVSPNAEASISKTLENCGWGTLAELNINDNRVIELKILLDWSTDIPIE